MVVLMERHRPVRVWWSPWRRFCACGIRWYPCPDAVRMDRPPVAQSLGHWAGPTLRLPDFRANGPLMTPGQRWRTRRRRR